ncbi:efflux RND transporter periplasmic adaptor subunit [Neisseriaceae bacterium TC5R-5]|nr:efflux RND transporter periplasmic adaptor subunit [Neisseriaceae bacterium TC5R-5]
MRLQLLVRYLITLLLLALAIWLGKALWDHYMYSPWTRDGRVRADVVNIAADVSGIVTQVAVKDNQLVRKGDILFVIDNSRYIAALAQANANLDNYKTEKSRRSSEAARRNAVDNAVVSAENRETASFAAASAGAQYQAALAARDLAQLNLQRTVVRAPVAGYVSNLNVHIGDFAAVGAAKLALLDSQSFYVEGYFEETKLPLLRAGAKVDIILLSGNTRLQGHIVSIARGITNRDAGTGRELLADVNPTFNWVRLAQRIPVRIALDKLPSGQILVAGTTCTVKVR